MRRIAFAILCIALVSGLVMAHPHFAKTIMAKIQNGPEFKLEHITLPYNEKHLAGVKEDFVFHCGYAKLTVNKDVQSGSTKIPAGTYALRAKATSADKWTLVLLPESAAPRQGQPDLSKAMVLDSKTLTGRPNHDHLELNIMPGHGPTDGKIMVSVSFGTRTVESVLSVGTAGSAAGQ